MEKCDELGLPFAPIARPENLFDDPHLNASGGMTGITLRSGRRTPIPVLPIEMNGRRFGARQDPPRIGQHTREVLEQLGYDAAEIARLAAEKVVRAG